MLKAKYGQYSSWAIWDPNNESDVTVIDKNMATLHSRFVFLGLNISRPLHTSPWINFHGGKHDRKLKYACSNNALHGAYITDIFKGIPEVHANELIRGLTSVVIEKNVKLFHEEMKDVGLTNESSFIILGNDAARCFDKYFKVGFSNNVIHHYHHSYYGIRDKEWVERLWQKMGIDSIYKKPI